MLVDGHQISWEKNVEDDVQEKIKKTAFHEMLTVGHHISWVNIV